MKNILEHLKKWAELAPNKLAITDGETEITYGSLWQQSRDLGAEILKREVPGKSGIAVIMNRGSKSLVAMLGAVCAGSFYIVIDSEMPEDRIETIFQKLTPALIVSDEANMEKANNLTCKGGVLEFQKAISGPDADMDEVLDKVMERSTDRDPVYALFTSGSSGIPKGTIITHRNILAYSEWVAKTFDINEDTVLRFRKTSVSFFRTTHSIPDTLGAAIKTPSGTIVCTGDYKFDLTPITNQPPNLQKMAKLGEEGVLCLLSDSTNAEIPNFTKSERWVGKSIKRIFEKVEGRIIFATFASNISRIQQAADAAVNKGRKIAVFGRSMEAAIVNGRELGYLNIPEDAIVDAREINSLPANKVMILCTGSQGEPMAALSRIANGTHRQVSIQPGDTVVFSSSPIPGNTLSVNKVINELEEAGATVIHGKVNNIHASGHGGQEEQKLMLRLMKPKFFMPVHGEYRMLKIHTRLAQNCDVPKENCYILENGDVLALTHDSARIAGHFNADDVYIDGSGIGDIGNVVLRDRRILSEEGLVVVVATIDMKNREVLSGPDLLSRGFIYMRESGELINKGRKQVFRSIKRTLKNEKISETMLKDAIVSDLQSFLFEQTERHPLIIPMLVTV